MRAKTLDQDQPSAEIDARVRATRHENESLYSLDLEALRSLRPDFIFTQDLCGVCSVTEAEVASACQLSGVTPRIVSLSPRSLEGVWQSITDVGNALELSERGQALSRELRERAGTTRIPRDPKRVAIVEWIDPHFLAGLWTADMISAAGGVPAGSRSGEEGARSNWAQLKQLSPDLVIVAPCSFSVPRTLRELRDSAAGAELDRLRPALGTWVADEAYFSRPGPRLAEGVELIRSLLEGREPVHPPMPIHRWGSVSNRNVGAS